MFENQYYSPKKQKSNPIQRKGISKTAPVQAILSKGAYSFLCQRSGASNKTEFQDEVETHLEHYAFLKEEIQRLGDKKDGREIPDGLRDNIYKALRLLHDFEQMIFRWKKGIVLNRVSIERSGGDDEIGINLRLLNEIQEERAFVTYYIRYFGLGLMPTYKYGLAVAAEVVYPEALKAIMDSTKRESMFMLMHSETDGSTHVETLKNQLMAGIGQLMAFPTGIKILTGLTNSMQRHHYTPTVELTPHVSAKKALYQFDLEEDSLSLSTGFKGAEYFLPSDGKNESILGRKKFAPLTFSTPYLQLAQILAEFTYKKLGSSDRRAFELMREDMLQLYKEAGLDAPLEFKRVHVNVKEAATVEETEKDGFVIIDPITDIDSPHSTSSSSTSTGEEDDDLMDLPQFDGKYRKQRVTYHGMRMPVGKRLQKEQHEFQKLRPTLGFSPDLIDWTTFHILGQQGVYGSVYGFKTLKGEERILKFTYVANSELLSFSRNPEKEAFASNFVKSLGQRVEAPGTLAIGKESPFLPALVSECEKCPDESVKKKLKRDIQKTGQQDYRYSCLVMERMEGVTRKNLWQRYGQAPGEAQLRRVTAWADTQAAMGELYVYDLILGNFDRFWATIHEGNVMLNVKMDQYNNHMKTPKVTPQPGKAVKAIDQTLSSYGQYMMIKSIKENKRINEGKNQHEVRQVNEEFLKVAKTTLNPDSLPLNFQEQLQEQLRYLRGTFKLLLDNLMAGSIGHSLPFHFLQTIQGSHADFTALEVGMIEALLRIKDKRSMLSAFSKIQFTEFTHDADYLFETCRMVDELVSEYDRRDIDYKLFQIQSATPGL